MHLVNYYEVHPEKKPDIVVVFNDDIGKYEQSQYNTNRRRENPNKNDLSGPFYEELQKDYYMEQTDCATIFIKSAK